MSTVGAGLQELLLGDAGVFSLVVQVSATSVAGYCVVILWYLPKGVVGRSEVSLGDF